MPVICLIAPSGEPVHLDEAKNDRRIDDQTADDMKIKALITAAREAVEARTRRQLLHARYALVLDAFPAGSACICRPVSLPAVAIQLPHSPVVRVLSVQYTDMNGMVQTLPTGDYVVNTALEPAILMPVFGKVWPVTLPQTGSVQVVYEAGYASPLITGGTLANNQFSVNGPVSWQAGDRVAFYNSGGLLPAPLDAESCYLIHSASGGIYTLTTLAGDPVQFSSAGSGRSFIGVVPGGIRSWILLRVGSLYESREEAALIPGKICNLPWVEGLLSPYIVDIY